MSKQKNKSKNDLKSNPFAKRKRVKAKPPVQGVSFTVQELYFLSSVFNAVKGTLTPIKEPVSPLKTLRSDIFIECDNNVKNLIVLMVEKIDSEINRLSNPQLKLNL